MEESNRFISPVNRTEVVQTDMAGNDPDTQCGVGRCRSRLLNRCGNMICFSAFYGMAGLFSATINMYVMSQITTLEKYFGFTSSQSGFLMSCNDIGFLLTTVFVSHLARQVHIPRVLSISTMVFGISGIICTLGYFLSPTFMTEGQGLLKGQGQSLPINATLVSAIKGGQLCDDLDKGECSDMKEIKIGAPTDFTSAALGIIAIGMIFQGFAKSPRQPFITCYIDDNVTKTSTGMYLGAIMSVAMFGPAIAFGIGGFFSQIYITLEDVFITPRDPRWIGAWWLGFLLFGCLSILAGIPLFFFPRRIKPRPDDQSDDNSGGILGNIKGVFAGLYGLVTNRLYMLVVLASCLQLFTIGGLVAFLPKYIETQFQVPTWLANILMGIVGVFAGVLGSFLGGCLVSKFKLSPVACAKLMVGITFFGVLTPVAGFLLGCDNPTVIGLNVARNHSADVNISQCTASCQCDDTDYFPVCGSDGRNYFSPCHAGCLDQKGQTFIDCGCVGENGTASPGLCDTKCTMMAPYLALGLVSGLVGTTAAMPSIIFSIRCVTDKQKSLAVGLSTFLQTLIGWMPGPIVTGMIIDTSCLTWSTSCRGKGACSMYDIEDFRLKRHLLEFCVRIVTLVMHIVMLYIAARHTDWSLLEQQQTTAKPEMKSLMTSTEKEKKKGQVI